MSHLAKSLLQLFLLTAALFGLPVQAKDDRLCDRVEYSFVMGSGGLNELSAKITLPTSGYAVALFQSAELIRPPKVYFICQKPDGMVSQVVSTYTAKLSTPWKEVSVIDAAGAQRIQVKSDGVMAMTATDTPTACRNNEGCGAGQFCDTTPKCPDGQVQGICVSKPQICPRNFLPVLACNGQTYSNHCEAMADGQSIPGVKRGKLLGSDGVFPFGPAGKFRSPGDAWPFSCSKLSDSEDILPWPWACKKTAAKERR
ncbi:hypothetical protein [Massilia sp. NR 4-1]|uniref:hypothetical protein n=1 Tax=Massilia sp. NR 4-1 TaxID=1678028 RepID=UPI000A90609C|nr:hypothetical protein [Massilia sp. NR 4-1]